MRPREVRPVRLVGDHRVQRQLGQIVVVLVVAGQVVQRDLHAACGRDGAEVAACAMERRVGDCLVKQRLAVHGHENAHIGGVHVHNAEAYVVDHVGAEDLAGNGLQNAALVAVALKLNLIGLDDDQNALIRPRHCDRVALVEVEAAPGVSTLRDHLLVLEVEHLAGELLVGESGQLIACFAARDGKTPVLEFRSISRVGFPAAFAADERRDVDLVAEASEFCTDACIAGRRTKIAGQAVQLRARDRLVEQRHVVCRHDDAYIRRIHVIHTERHPIGLAAVEQILCVRQEFCAGAVLIDLKLDHIRLDAGKDARSGPRIHLRAASVEVQAAPLARSSRILGEGQPVLEVQHAVGELLTRVAGIRFAVEEHFAGNELRCERIGDRLPVGLVVDQAVNRELRAHTAQRHVHAVRSRNNAEASLCGMQILVFSLIAEDLFAVNGQHRTHVCAVDIVQAELDTVGLAAFKRELADLHDERVGAVIDLKLCLICFGDNKNALLAVRQVSGITHVEVEAAPAVVSFWKCLLIIKEEGLVRIRSAGIARRLIGGRRVQRELAADKGGLAFLVAGIRRPVFRILDQCVDLDHIGRGTGVLVVAEAGVRLLERSHAEIKVILADRVLCQYGLRVGNGRRDEVNFLLCPLAGIVADLCGFDLSFGLVYQRAEFRLIYRTGERHENRLRPDRFALCAAAVHRRDLAADPLALADGGHGELGAGHVVADLFPVQVEQVVAAFGNIVVCDGRALAVAVRVREGVDRVQCLANRCRAGNGHAGSSRLLVAGEALHADPALVDLLEAGQLRQDGIDERVIAVCIVDKQLTVIACALQDHQIVVEAGDLAFLIVICLDPRIGARLAAARRSVGVDDNIVLEDIRDIDVRLAVSQRRHPRPAGRVQFVVPDLTQGGRDAEAAVIRHADCKIAGNIYIERTASIDEQIVRNDRIVAAVDLDSLQIFARGARAEDIAGDCCAAQTVVQIDRIGGEAGERAIIVGNVVEMVVPDDHALAARVAAAVDRAHVLAVQNDIMERVVFNHAVQRGRPAADDCEVQRHIRNVVDFVVGERVLHTAEFHAALVHRPVLVRIVDTAVRNEIVARLHGLIVTAIQIDGRDGGVSNLGIFQAGIGRIVNADGSAFKAC